jgi:hypothetical protein
MFSTSDVPTTKLGGIGPFQGLAKFLVFFKSKP